MDWLNWVPQELAVLCFIVQDGRVLLIHKKRGLGAGKVNAPGGKIEPGETDLEAAVRETEEEVGVTPGPLTRRGSLHFQFSDGYSLRCEIFVAEGCTGELIETAEATPFWAPLEAVPYEEMWEDDQHWLPQVLAGQAIAGWFEFDGERMLSKEVQGRRVLIAGCGELGVQAAERFAAAGWAVTGCIRSPEKVGQTPFADMACDLASRAQVEALPGPFDAIVHCASSGRGGADAYRQVYVEGMRNLSAVFQTPVLFVSSTSVYAQTDGEWVTEDSPAEPDRETGRLLREAEGIALSHGGAVARLAGLYGPRSVLLRKFLTGEALLEGDGERWINQVHRGDAGAALFRLVEQRARGIYNVSDHTPMTQRELYEGLAARLGRPLPPSGPIDPNRKRGWTNKRVSNRKLRALGGWEPLYPTFFGAVTALPDLGAS